MTRHNKLQRIFLAQALGLLLTVLAPAALAQADPSGRIARLNFNEGSVAFSPAGETEWVDVPANRPLAQGDRLWTDKGSRAELHAGSTAVRLGGQTHAAIVELDDHVTRLLIPHGVVQVRVRELFEGDNFQFDTPNLSFRALQAGEYRIDVDSATGTTRVTVHSGTGLAYGESGQAVPMGGGQQIVFRARTLSQAGAQESPPQDSFDRWAIERDRREDQSIAARYVPREVTGYQQLDGNGNWSRDPAYGAVWTPRDVDTTWAPFRNGRWESITPWGWTWIDDAPWGFATSHYGRWAIVAEKWAWVPGRMPLRPVYAPALVAFAGNPDGSSVRLISGRPGVAWFPLAPGEAWKPAFHASPVYVSNANRNMKPGEPAAGAYVHRRAEAVTAVALEDFHPGTALRARLQRIAVADVARLQAATPPQPLRSTAPDPAKLQLARIVAPRAVPSQAQAPQPQAAASRQVTITREQVQLALQAQEIEQARREQAQRDEAERAKAQREQAEREQARLARQKAEQAQAQAHALAQARLARQKAEQRREDQRRAQQLREQAQLQAQRQARAQQQARLQREQAKQEQVRRAAQAQAQQVQARIQAQAEAESQARHEAQVRRALGLANAEAQAQERRRQLQGPFTGSPQQPGTPLRERRS